MRLLVVGVVLTCTNVALADDESKAAQAQALFEEGRALLAADNPRDACGKFEAVLKLEPEDLGAILNLGLCNEQLGRIATALKWFRRAQVRASEQHLADAEAAAKAKTGALAGRVPTLTITFAQPPPRPARVTLDGVHVEDIDFPRLELDAGHHVVVAADAEGPFAHRELDIADGAHQDVALALRTKPAPRKELVTVDRGAGQRRTAYIVGGVGGGLVAGACTLGLVGRHAANATEHPDEQRRWRDTLRYGGTSLFLVGGAAVATGVWMYVRAPGKEVVERTYVTVARDAIGVGVRGAF